MENNYDTLDALRDVEASRRSTANRVTTPWWYHPILGLGVAALCMAVAYFENLAVFLVLVLVSLVTSITVATVYKKVTGLWVNWPEAGPAAGKVGIAFTATLAACMGVSALIGMETNPLFALPVAAVAWAGTVIFGRMIDQRMREHILTRAGEGGTA